MDWITPYFEPRQGYEVPADAVLARRLRRLPHRERGGRGRGRQPRRPAPRTRRVVAILSNFGKMLLVFGWIGTDLCKWIRVFQDFSKSTRLSSCNFWNLAKICKFCNICKTFAEFSRKLLIFQTNVLLKFWDCRGSKVCKSCSAWKMLSNAYFLAKFRFDTTENEPAKDLQKQLLILLTLHATSRAGRKGGDPPARSSPSGVGSDP